MPTEPKSNLRTAAMLGLEHLYHYQSFNLDHLREVIVDGVIHFSKPSDFNDPWDCRPLFDFECLSDARSLEQHVQWYIDVSRSPHQPLIKTAVRMQNKYQLMISAK